MNFNIIFTLLILACACGVKTKPKAPEGSSLPSIVKQYEQLTIQEKDKTEKKKLK